MNEFLRRNWQVWFTWFLSDLMLVKDFMQNLHFIFCGWDEEELGVGRAEAFFGEDFLGGLVFFHGEDFALASSLGRMGMIATRSVPSCRVTTGGASGLGLTGFAADLRTVETVGMRIFGVDFFLDGLVRFGRFFTVFGAKWTSMRCFRRFLLEFILNLAVQWSQVSCDFEDPSSSGFGFGCRINSSL